MSLWRVVIVMAAAALFATPVAAEEITGMAEVIDGDDLMIAGERIRLDYIDAPERDQTCRDDDGEVWLCAQRAIRKLQNKIGDNPVRCAIHDTDRYDRSLAVCFSGKTDLNGWMVENGWAVAYRRHGLNYAPHEDRARERKRGIWSSHFVKPWKWRQRTRRRDGR